MQRFFTILIAALLIISSATTPGRAAGDLTKPRHYVEDYANVINASQERESALTCIPYLRPECLAAVQLQNFSSGFGMKLRQSPHLSFCSSAISISPK